MWLIFVILFTAALITGGLKLFYTANLSETTAHFRQQAYYLAESGGRYAVPLVTDDLINGVTTGIDALNGKTFTLVPGGQFHLTVDTADPDRALIHARGTANPGSNLEARVSLTFQLDITRSSGFGGAVFSDGEMKFDNNSGTDSYDSSKGQYGAGNIGSNGDVATNSGAIDSGNNVRINGQISTSSGRSLDPVVLPACGEPCTDLGDYEVRRNRTRVITAGASGDFKADDVKLDNNATLEISGDVVLIVRGDFETSNNSSVVILSGSSLRLYVDGDIKFDNNSRINRGGLPENMTIYATANSGKVELSNNAAVFAAIYAPETEVLLDNNSQLYGALVGASVEVNNNAKIHFDEALTTAGGGGAGGAITVSDPIQYYSR